MNIEQIVRDTLAGGAGGAQLAELALRLGSLEEIWRPIVEGDGGRQRHWLEIYSDEGIDVYAIGWLPGHLSDMHDHGESSFGLACVGGEVLERRMGTSGDTIGERAVGPGQMLFGDTGVLHQIHWSAGEPAVTIHCFAPRFIKQGRYHSSRGGILLHRRDLHGCMRGATEITA